MGSTLFLDKINRKGRFVKRYGDQPISSERLAIFTFWPVGYMLVGTGCLALKEMKW